MNVQLVYDFQEYQKTLSEFDLNSKIKSILVLSTFKGPVYQELLTSPPCNINKQVWGAVFPQVIFQSKVFEDKTVVVGLETECDVLFLKNLSQKKEEIDDALEAINIDEVKTTFVFLDVFSNQADSFVASLFDNFGLCMNFLGAGCGSVDFQQRPCIISSEGVLENAAVLGFSKSKSHNGVNHGWKSVKGPMKITAAQDNMIKEIDYMPAFNVYKRLIQECSGKIITKDNFFSIAKSFPLGIPKLDSEFVIRDPISVNEQGEISCVAQIENNTFVHLMTGNEKTLISSAKDALLEACTDGMDGDFIIFDCISRSLFLSDHFQKELDVIPENNFGCLVFGEIANKGEEYLEFHNKTILINRYLDVM